MITKNTNVNKLNNKSHKRGLRLALIGLGSLLLLTVALTLFLSGNVATTAAKAKPEAGVDNKDLVKTLKLISVESPASFKGQSPYATVPLAGQKLLAITVDFDRDFQSHLRSSEAGEVYLTDPISKATYYTVDTGLPKSEGPGKKPVRQATFVFAVPAQQNIGTLTFHYGAQYALALPDKAKN